jgi:hypothetical protein
VSVFPVEAIVFVVSVAIEMNQHFNNDFNAVVVSLGFSML